MWDSRTGEELIHFNYNSEADTVLCINLSNDNRSLVASATSGLVLVINTSFNEYFLASNLPVTVYTYNKQETAKSLLTGVLSAAAWMTFCHVSFTA